MQTASRAKRYAAPLAWLPVLLIMLAVMPVRAFAHVQFPLTFTTGNSSIRFTSTNSTSLSSILFPTDTLPVESDFTVIGSGGGFSRLAGFKGSDFKGRTVVVGGPGTDVGKALAELGYGPVGDLTSYSLTALKLVSQELSIAGSGSRYYTEFYSFAKEGALWRSIELTNGESLQVRLVGVRMDDKSDGSKAGLTFMATHSLKAARQINTSASNNGGWAASQLRAALNPAGTDEQITSDGNIWTLLPQDLRDSITPVKKVGTSGGTSTTAATTKNYLWVPSKAEISRTANTDKDGTIYTFFDGRANSDRVSLTKTVSGSLMTGFQGSGATTTSGAAWLRTPLSTDTSKFYVLGSSGSTTETLAPTYKLGVVLAFCI